MAIRTIPSLIIGLGGTGKRALTHLKRRIADTYHRDDLPWVRLLSIDTDDGDVSNPPVVSQHTGKRIELGISESKIIDQSDTPKVISNLDAPENRHIKDWYPDPEIRVDFPKAAKGSGQMRMFGRVALYKGENLYTTYRWLQQSAQEVSDPAAWDEFRGFDIDPGRQFIYIVSSLCGGTGSGMLLDVAYMLRKIVGVDPSTRRFIGMFVLPEVYEPVVENQHLKRIYANSYAALREMDFLMNSQRRSYVVRGKDHTFVDFERDVAPFDLVFLLSNKNKRGAVISSRQLSEDKPMAADDRICQYISESIMTDILSPVTERNESILSNIFTSLGDPEQVDGRMFYKSFSSVGVSSVKIPPLADLQELLELKILDHVIDFLLRPDPDVTERDLAKQFFADNFSKLEDNLPVRASLNSDPSYGRFKSRPFHEEFRINRPACLDSVKQWFERLIKYDIDRDSPLEIEKQAVAAYKDAISRAEQAVSSALRNFASDPHHGYTFIREWLDELLSICKSKQAQTPPARQVDGDPRRPCQEALDSLTRVGSDIQLPLIKDTVSILVERVAGFYDGFGREERNNNLIRSFYADLIAIIEKAHRRLTRVTDTISEIFRATDVNLSSRIAGLDDVGGERVLIDKGMIGRKEIERFLNYIISPVLAGSDWKTATPALSDELQQRIDSEIASRLMEIGADSTLDDVARLEKIKKTLVTFVRQRIFDQLFPVDPATGRAREPNYTDSEGRSIIFEFGPENLLPLMVAHSSPLWFVQTHQVGSATSPVMFVGVNGTRIPEHLVEAMQKQNPNFRPTDLVLSDVEPRIVVKQFDPLYSLASLANIVDYENFYKTTDRQMNPMHTDLRFTSEPNPYLQWLSYKPAVQHLKLCSRGHDITRSLHEGKQFCPDCAHEGIRTYIVPGKLMCPYCGKVIDEGSRKCPECLAILEQKKVQCPGCIAQGKDKPELVTVRKGETEPVYCPQCGSLWTDSCPYCNAPLERPTVCTRGSDRCIFESPPIILCQSCNCPVTPETGRCPRCFAEMRECADCRVRGEARRMMSRAAKECPLCCSAKAPLQVS